MSTLQIRWRINEMVRKMSEEKIDWFRNETFLNGITVGVIIMIIINLIVFFLVVG